MKSNVNDIYIVASTFYSELSDQLIEGAILANSKDNINVVKVPGAFEIPGMIKNLIDNKKPDLIIAFGVLIKGESDHFEYISSSVSNSISQLTITSKIPIIFGILTTQNMNQAIERAYISKKNKGGEAMNTGIEMLKLYDQYKK